MNEQDRKATASGIGRHSTGVVYSMDSRVNDMKKVQ